MGGGGTGCPPPRSRHCTVTFPKATLQPCPKEGSCWENCPSTLNGKNSWLEPRGNSRISKAVAGEALGWRGLPHSGYSVSLTRQQQSQMLRPAQPHACHTTSGHRAIASSARLVLVKTTWDQHRVYRRSAIQFGGVLRGRASRTFQANQDGSVSLRR